MDRRTFVDEALWLGWKLSSAEADTIILECQEPLLMTGWFVKGQRQLGLVVISDVLTGETVQQACTAPILSPVEALSLIEDVHRVDN